jgi:anti-sigma regulatory factor (Ser/Thr protein kinase)
LALDGVSLPARAARATTAEVCRRWGLADLVDTAQLVVSELVTNAVEHAVAGRTPAATAGAPGAVLTLAVTGTSVLVEVADPDPRAPVVRQPGLWDEGGRGMMLVATESASWGWEPRDGGKVVWATLALPAPAQRRAAPRRTRTVRARPGRRRAGSPAGRAA